MKVPVHKKRWRINKKNLLISLFFVMLVSTSILGLVSNDRAPSQKYKNMEFKKIDQGWISFYANRQIFIPSDIPSLNDPKIQKLDLSPLNLKEKIYFSRNPLENNKIAIAQFNSYIALSPRKVDACITDIAECADTPLKTCKDATDKVGVIIFQEANETEVSFNDGCLLIQGKDLLKTTDQFILEQLQ